MKSKLSAILRIIRCERFYLYADHGREYSNVTMEDIKLINQDTANIFNEEVQADMNVQAVQELVNPQ